MELQVLEDKLAESELDSCLSDSSSTHSSHQLPQETLDSETKVKDYISELNTISNSQHYLPKPELLTFSGNPMDYCKFILNFKTNIESQVQDPRLRLSYLIQFCCSDAKFAIEDCVVLPPLEGYARAREILKNRYGKSHLVARSHVDRLVNGPSIRSNDVQGLMNLSLDMEKCELTLSQLGYTSDINNTEHLRKIVRRLPHHAKSKWVDYASTIIEQGSEPTIRDLMRFKQQRAAVANTMYGRDLAHDSKQTVSSRSPQVNSRDGGRVTLSMTGSGRKAHTVNESNSRSKRVFNCVYCQGSHKLIECERFQSLGVDDKLSVVRERGMCENCLYFNHTVDSCRRNSQCSVARCGGKHHTLLHIHLPVVNQGVIGQSNCCTEDDATIPSKVSLRIVPVVVQYGPRKTETYALLDEGSDVTLCSDSLVRKLEARGVSREFTITTVDQIHKLWTTDFPDCSLDTKVGMSQEDRRALSFIDNSLEKEGRHFKIGLPWRDEKVSLPDNRALAVTRLAQLRIKFPFKRNGLPYCEARL